MKNDFWRSIKSTIGRSFIATLADWAPGAVEERAARAFTRPDAPLPPAEPMVAGLTARRFELDAGSERLAAWEWGAGPTVLLVHGWNGRAAQLSPFVAPLVEAGFYVVAFDLPAHGSSTGTHTHLPGMARAVARAAHKLGPVHGIVAHSLGAAASALAIAEGVAVGRAVLLAPPVEARHFVRAFAAHIGLPPARLAGLSARIEKRVGATLDELDLRRVAPALRTPLLVVHDPRDREVPFAHGQALAHAWPGARLEEARRLGHHRLLADRLVVDHVVGFMRDGNQKLDLKLERRSA